MASRLALAAAARAAFVEVAGSPLGVKPAAPECGGRGGGATIPLADANAAAAIAAWALIGGWAEGPAPPECAIRFCT